MESIKKAALLIFLIGMGSVVSPLKANAQNALDWDRASISTSMVTGAAVLIASASRFLIDGVALSSTLVSNVGWVSFRDTDTANSGLFVGGGTGINLTVYFGTSTTNASTSNGIKVQNFSPPIRFYRGISVDAAGCGTATSICYTVLYRRVAD